MIERYEININQYIRKPFLKIQFKTNRPITYPKQFIDPVQVQRPLKYKAKIVVELDLTPEDIEKLGLNEKVKYKLGEQKKVKYLPVIVKMIPDIG